jgi:hypothetical protein
MERAMRVKRQTGRPLRAIAVDRGWWQATGGETCSVCAARFDLEVEVRCVACDAPLCPVCAVVVSGAAERVCAGCTETGEEG